MILTPQQLWKDYDRKAVPLGVATVRTGEDAGSFFRTLYFNGERAADGVTRIYAKLYEPKCRFGNAAVIVFDDIRNTVDGFDPALYLNNGFAVLVVDYAGAKAEKERFTIYPKSLAYVNYFLNLSLIEDALTPPKESCWYVFATMALRAVTFLEETGYEDLFILGVGHGGAQVWKTCYFENTVRAGAAVFSGGPRKPSRVLTPEEEKTFLTYRAAIDSSAYANFIKSPIFMQITSNEQNSSLDRMNELYDAAAENTFLSISERANRQIDGSRTDNIVQWFSAVLRGERLPAPPALKAKGSENKLYYDIKVSKPAELAEISLFVAHMQKNSAFRNWRVETVQAVSEDEYLAKVDVLSADEPVFAFANVRYKTGLCLSSRMERTIPSALSVAPAPLIMKRLIYDSGMGLSDWLVLTNPGADMKLEPALSMQKGPFNLEGVVSSSNMLTTFRLADPQYKGRPGASLQFTVFSPGNQKISFNIRTSEESLSKYVCQKELAGEPVWTKLSLSPRDFRGAGGALSDWQNVLTLEIESAETMLVNSLLWV